MNRLFFTVQNILKYVPFKWCVHLRALCYRPFFAHVGSEFAVHDAVTIKYPSDITVGSRVTINTMCFVAGLGGLRIGNDVMIGAGSKIVSANHGTDRFDVPMQNQPLQIAPVVIEDDVWLGFDVKVLPGSTIRRGAIIGAGAVVRGEIPEYAVAVGVPARVVSSRRK